MKKLLSFDLESHMGFLKKPDINDGIYLTYNMIHKPALLGILGAIIGLRGYTENGTIPEYYDKLKNLQVGVEPLKHEKGNFQKTVVKYCNGVGYASGEEGGNLIIVEQTLIKPTYRIYLLLDLEDSTQEKLYNYITECKAEYLPYLGKNDHSTWWTKDNVKEYEYEESKNNNESFSIKSIFRKSDISVKNQKQNSLDSFDIMNTEEELPFIYFERLPIGFNEVLMQYELTDFAYTNYLFKKDTMLNNLIRVKNESKYIQLF
jgi:CRISPR-associated protein Cas5h